MWIRSQRFPIVSGALVSLSKSGLTAKGWASGLTVRPEIPAGTTSDPLTPRMVAIRDDGGSSVGRVQVRRQGVNVWADSALDAENIALDLMQILMKAPTGSPIVSTSEFVGPYKVPVDVPLTVGNKNLTNFYFSFRCGVKASAA